MLSDPSLGTSVLVIFLICAGFVLIRGIARLLVGVAVLCGSAWIAFRVWQWAPALSIDWLGKPVPWLTNGLPVAAFLSVFLLGRQLARFLVRPFGTPDGGNAPRTPARLLGLGLATLLPTAVLWLTGATLIHHFGSIEELKSAAGSRPESSFSGCIRRFKDAVASALPAAWLQKLDPLADPDRLSLARLISSQPDPGLPPVINPDTGKPYPRAVVVDDPELQSLAKQRDFGTLLRHPLFQKALHDPKVQQALRDLK